MKPLWARNFSNGRLPGKRNPTERKFNRQGFFVHILEKSGAQVSMDLYRGSNDSPGQVIDSLAWLC